MRPRFVLAWMLLALTAPAGLAVSAATAQPVAAEAVRVSIDRSRVNVVIGDRFTIRTPIANTGGTPTDRLIAHLNVASLTRSVYVDPEDWSSNRTEEVTPLGPGSSTSLSWELQAVNAGDFDVYVVLLPNGPASSGQGPLVVSPPVHVQVAGRPTLSAGGALPIVVAVPGLLGLVVAAVGLRARRTR
jgi:hypothetical protein